MQTASTGLCYQARYLRRAITPAPMRPRRATAPAKAPATVPVRASFGAGVCFVGVEGAGLGVAGVEGAGVAGAEGTGVAVTEGVGAGVAGVEGAGVEGVELGSGVGLFATLRITMSMFAPTARASAGLLGSTVRAAASKPRIVWPGTISYPSGNAGMAVAAARDGSF